LLAKNLRLLARVVSGCIYKRLLNLAAIVSKSSLVKRCRRVEKSKEEKNINQKTQTSFAPQQRGQKLLGVPIGSLIVMVQDDLHIADVKEAVAVGIADKITSR